MAIIDVLKFESSADIFAWRHPNTELATWTQLIVNESQEAILVRNGQIADIFGPGHYTLSTDNIPVLQKLINLPFGKRSPFSAEVWFINKAFSLNIKWGTTTPIQIQDPKYNVFVPVRAFGQFGIQIVDAKRFLIKLVGTMRFFNKNTLTEYFRGNYVMQVKDNISTCLVRSRVSVLEINAHLNELSEELKKQLAQNMADYGIDLVSFYVNDISVPENDPAVKQLKAALAKRAEMDIIGYNYQQERTFDTLETAADNQGAAGMVMGSGIGLGMGFGVGGAIGSQAQNMQGAMNTTEQQKDCPSCGKKIGASLRFCPHCGSNTEKPKNEPKCSACGAVMMKNVKFCAECGRKLNPCRSCGADVPDGAAACPACGAAFCPECGGEVAAGAKFCPHCGKTLVTEKKCPGCGEVVAEGVKFCQNCGTKLI